MISTFCISKNLLGTKQDFIYDNGWYWGENKNFFELTNNIEVESQINLNLLFRFNLKQINTSPQQKYVSMAKALNKDILPWKLVMTNKDFKDYLTRLISDIQTNLKNCITDYYDIWDEENAIFENLESCFINKQKLDDYLKECSNEVVCSFKSNSKELQVPSYDRLKGITGRTIVSSGPNILGLHKKYRDIIESKFGSEGKIFYLDFSSLESRLLLYEAGKDCIQDDLYDFLSKKIFSSKYDRNLIKGVVLSDLYGMSAQNIANKLSIEFEESKVILQSLRHYFNTNNLKERLKLSYIKNGHIQNKYKRCIQVDEPYDHIFMNYYAQSSGVDVSLLGFSSIVDFLKENKIRPLFVLHDALIIDCPKQSYDKLKQLNKVKIKGYVQKFNLTCKESC